MPDNYDRWYQEQAKSAICEALKTVYGDSLKAVYDKSSGTALLFRIFEEQYAVADYDSDQTYEAENGGDGEVQAEEPEAEEGAEEAEGAHQQGEGGERDLPEVYEQEDEKHGDGRHEGGQNLGDDLFVHGGEAAVFYDDAFRKPVLELLFYVFLQPLHRGRLAAPAFHIRIDADRVPACQTREFGELPVGFEGGQLPQGNADSRHGGGHHQIAQGGVV